MSWFYVILFLCFTFDNVSEARHHSKLPSAVVVGTVYCDTCFQQDFSKNSHFISGASVAVECKDESSRPSFHQEVKTNEYGEFRVNLPFSVGKHVKRIKKCSVKLLSSSEPYCAVASTATSSSLRLKSRKEGTHIFSAGFFSFKPQKQPILCNQKPSIQNSATDNFSDFPPPLQDPVNNNNFLPPLPILPPLPQVPPLPGVPSLPSPSSLPSIPSVPPKKSVKGSQQSDQKVAQPNFFLPTPPFFPPNPFQPPPILPPIFQPPPFFPPLLPPNPLQPPPAPLIPLPPIPFLTPPPPPPVIPFPPFTPFPPLPPLPPFPFPPPPRSPGIPPASTSHRTSSP